MVSLSEISPVLWIVWAIIGFCGGYMTSRLLLENHYAFFLSVAGIVGALAGGFILLTLVTDPGDERMTILSLLTSAVGTAAVIWPAWAVARTIRQRKRGDDD